MHKQLINVVLRLQVNHLSWN